MKNRNLVIMGVVIASLFLFSNIFSSSALAAAPVFPKIVIKLGVSVNPDFNFCKGSVKFGELMKERTGGAVEVQVFPNGTLGSDNDMIEQVRNQIIQMWAGGSMTLSMIKGWEPLNVVNLPYILKQNTEQEQNKFLNDLFQMPFMIEMAERGAKTSGIRALDLNWFYGMRHVTNSNRAIKGPADLKGLKIRTMPSPIGRVAMDELGASPTPMAFPEVYSALQMGVIDGQENPPATIAANKFYEVQKYLSLTGHTTQSIVLCINESFYQGLSPELRKIFQEAAIDAGKYQSDLQLKDNMQSIEQLKQKGMAINNIDRAEFIEKTKDSWKKFPDITKDLYEKIINYQK
jgi:TRAP-type transport system periplasmic protein